jgi:hypothetical protein
MWVKQVVFVWALTSRFGEYRVEVAQTLLDEGDCKKVCVIGRSRHLVFS